MERPAHTALFQSIWNHPAEENGQNVNLGSCVGRGGSFCGVPSPLPLLVAAIICALANYRVVHLVIFQICLFLCFWLVGWLVISREQKDLPEIG